MNIGSALEITVDDKFQNAINKSKEQGVPLSISLQKWFYFAFTGNVRELQNCLNEGISINAKLPWVWW